MQNTKKIKFQLEKEKYFKLINGSNNNSNQETKTNVLNHESKLAIKNEVWKSQNMW